MKEKFCIAGFDTYEKRMKRLMIDGGYWNTDQIPPSYCEILVDNEEFKEPRDYPHRTEDVNINFDSIEVLQEFEPGKELVNALRDIFEKGKDVENLNNAVAASQYAHCRIGLARKFLMQENHCYLMLNGLFLY